MLGCFKIESKINLTFRSYVVTEKKLIYKVVTSLYFLLHIQKTCKEALVKLHMQYGFECVNMEQVH